MLKALCITLLITAFSLQAAEPRIIEYEVSYLSVPLLDMTLTWMESDSTVLINYDNQIKPFIGYFHPIHNIYKVKFLKGTYQPLSWSKTISEGSMNFHLSASLSESRDEVHFTNHQTRRFPQGAFTVFSATHYLADRADDSDFFPARIKVYIDGETWEATAQRFTPEMPHPDFHMLDSQVLIQTDLHYLSGERIMKQNDILMTVIATEGTRFMLWVNPDGSYSKAQFGAFPKAVVLDRITK